MKKKLVKGRDGRCLAAELETFLPTQLPITANVAVWLRNCKTIPNWYHKLLIGLEPDAHGVSGHTDCGFVQKCSNTYTQK